MRVVLGKTGIEVEKNGFGALPIQRISDVDAVYLLRKAYENGIDFFDTARAYSDSEHKIGLTFSPLERERIIIATKSGAQTGEKMMEDLKKSLSEMKTDYIDIYQFHNPAFCPVPGGKDGLYDAALEAKKAGLIKHIGITNHRLNVANEAIDSGLYETLQFPFCYLATDKDIELVKKCKEKNIGFIAMKSLSGGLITNARAAAAFANEYDNVVPIWGVQRERELDEFLSFVGKAPKMDEELAGIIAKDKEELSGDFCRGCGYCMPCPMGIEINNCARMSLLLRRSPSASHLSPEGQEKMMKIESCVGCGSCKSKCPYGLDTPNLLKKNLEDYKNVLEGKTKVN